MELQTKYFIDDQEVECLGERYGVKVFRNNDHFYLSCYGKVFATLNTIDKTCIIEED